MMFLFRVQKIQKETKIEKMISQHNNINRPTPLLSSATLNKDSLRHHIHSLSLYNQRMTNHTTYNK